MSTPYSRRPEWVAATRAFLISVRQRPDSEMPRYGEVAGVYGGIPRAVAPVLNAVARDCAAAGEPDLSALGEPPTTRADLIVRTADATLLVEAKVDAHEQPGQLDRLRRSWSEGEDKLFVLLLARSSHQQMTSLDGGDWHATSWAKFAEAVARQVSAPRTAELEAVLRTFREIP